MELLEETFTEVEELVFNLETEIQKFRNYGSDRDLVETKKALEMISQVISDGDTCGAKLGMISYDKWGNVTIRSLALDKRTMSKPTFTSNITELALDTVGEANKAFYQLAHHFDHSVFQRDDSNKGTLVVGCHESPNFINLKIGKE